MNNKIINDIFINIYIYIYIYIYIFMKYGCDFLC